ncbi:MAG: hypothetical protein LBJ72_08215 [Dysgonamonadaceae bacterium]|jgi:hypothetical protein|nr:hypothetical protein [Dysgonamonadaceae bacterium]
MFDFLVKNKIKSLCKTDHREKKFLSMDKIRTALILFDTRDYEVADAFVEHLEKIGKKVKGVGYKRKEDKYDYSETPYRIIKPKVDTNASGAPAKELITELSSQKYDVLMDLSIKENITLEYLVVSLNIPLKVGLKKNKLPVYDLSISKLPKNEENSDCVELGRQILHYLSTIHSE